MAQEVGKQNDDPHPGWQRSYAAPLVAAVPATDVCRYSYAKLMKNFRDIAETISSNDERIHWGGRKSGGSRGRSHGICPMRMLLIHYEHKSVLLQMIIFYIFSWRIVLTMWPLPVFIRPLPVFIPATILRHGPAHDPLA
jgi:hypothetical protein